MATAKVDTRGLLAVSEHILDNEAKIVWLDKHTGYPYLREETFHSHSRSDHFEEHRGQKHEIVIGYSVLKASAQPDRSGRFERRRWYITKHDFLKVAPADAAEPKSIRAGERSKAK
ncbi:MAG: DUF6009 family protein [Ktedonobacterales bacterium]